MELIAAVRIRGRVGLKPDIAKTLELLKLNRKFTVAVMEKNPAVEGMLQKVKDYITWGEISKELLNKLEKVVGSKGKAIKYFRLPPPKGGLRPIKKHLPYGALGYRGREIEKLIEKMLESYELSRKQVV